MTEQELNRYRRWCKQKWNGNGEDVFQQACLIAMERYGIDKVNQNLFGLLCREAARQLQYHQKYEIPFSYLAHENTDQTNEMPFDLEDMEWKRPYIAIEEQEEIEKIHGKWLLNALLKAVTEPPKNMVTTDRTVYGEQMKLFEYA